MEIHSPRVIHVVALLRERLHEPYILVKPVEALIVDGLLGAHAAIVITPIA
jgi:hypothetical protein